MSDSDSSIDQDDHISQSTASQDELSDRAPLAEEAPQNDNRARMIPGPSRRVSDRSSDGGLSQIRSASSERERMARRRSNETNDQREARLLRDRERRLARLNREFADLIMCAFNYRIENNWSNHPLIRVDEMQEECTFCHALKFSEEPPGFCCNSGTVLCPEIQPPPEPYLNLFDGDTDISQHFIEHIRAYNGSFQMTSFGADVIDHQRGFQTTFRIQGQVYHRMGSLLPMPNDPPKFLQIYFIGMDRNIDERSRRNEEANHRVSLFDGLRQNLVLLWNNLLHDNNRLVRQFVTAIDQMPSDQSRLVIVGDRTPIGEHRGRYNAPTVDEVALIMVDDPALPRDIVIQRRNNEPPQRIVELHPSYDALQYPIIFWRGDSTYNINMAQVDPVTKIPNPRKKVSTMSYYAYQFMIRRNRTNFILECASLLNQYVVDMWAKIESERLRFLRSNQSTLRVDRYQELHDALNNDGDPDNVGRRLILPSTFIGGPRHMHEYSQDALSYVREYGRPDLFITITCNPNWSEIVVELAKNRNRPRKAPNRHDLICRIFKQKLNRFKRCLTKYQFFGSTKAFMYVVEWQKRGLPHAHFLIWLENRIRPEDIDKIICAEIPSPEEDPILHQIVSNHMIHNPCGVYNRSAPCLDADKRTCLKKFPKRFVDQTQSAEDGYPLYRRRQNGHTFTKTICGNSVLIDNSWVVPYNPTLLKTFNCHINVEYCHSVKSIKYLCKYVNKGSDQAVIEINPNIDTNDEIAMYQTGRYISSNEAFWHIFSFPIHERDPPVIHLQVHLPNGQRIVFNRDNARERAENPPSTTLTAFFDLCQHDEFARTLLYSKLPEFYVWNIPRKTWTKRRQGFAIGRIYSVHPNHQECFYLRLLLNHVRGPTSFESLRTFNGILSPTFRDACIKYGLLEDDAHWQSTMQDATLVAIPSQIRLLFAIIISTCQPAEPQKLWDLHKNHMCDDILRQRQDSNPNLQLNFDDDIYNRALILIEDQCMSIAGKMLFELGIHIPLNRRRNDINDADMIRETSYDRGDLRSLLDDRYPRLVNDQKMAFNTIRDSINNSEAVIYFIDAPGGTGKTYLINLILAFVRQRGQIALAVASSGIAATLLDGGRTAHSTFKLPLDIGRNSYPACNITRQSAKGRLLAECKLIVWDECTMSHKDSLTAVNNSLKDMRRSNNLMGGTVVVLAGDFRQTLPVVPKGTRADEFNASFKKSEFWPFVKTLKLRTNMRVVMGGDNQAASFSNKLLALGDGKINPDINTGLIRLPPNFCQYVANINDLIDKVFPNLHQNLSDIDWLCGRAILAPLNDTVSTINDSIQDKLPGDTTTYLSIDTVVNPDQAVDYPVEVMNSLRVNGLPDHKLSLKIGSPIMILRNLNPPQLCNGTRLVVRQLLRNLIKATIISGKYRGEDVVVPRIPMIPTDTFFEFKRLQFPVRLAFAMTINKSQGQTLNVVGIDVSKPCFSHGQLYVACSRVGNSRNMYVLAPNNETKNIVYPEALN